MTSKLRSIFKRQVSQPVNTNVENTEESSAIMREMKSVPAEFLRHRRNEKFATSDVNGSSTESATVLRRKPGIRRHNTSLGAIEDLLKCPICKDRLKSPRMMPCQHTFCQSCLAKRSEKSKAVSGADAGLICPLCSLTVSDRAPELLPTNLYIESLLRVMESPGEGWLRLASAAPAVSFAPVPDRTSESDSASTGLRSPGLQNRCSRCPNVCGKDNGCKHCKQIFCGTCWISHVDELKEEFDKIIVKLDTTSGRFETRIEEFRAQVDEFKASIDRDTEARIAELEQEREERIRRLNYRASRGEDHASEVKRRLAKVSDEVKEMQNGSYDALGDNGAKVRVFVSLHREATELANLERTWSPELAENASGDSKDSTNPRGDIDLFYRRKTFERKVIANREVMQRPCGMAHDPRRNHIFVACPGTRQIVVLDGKYKLIKRYRSADMMAPQALAYVESTEELFVTDKWKHCIYVFDCKGEGSARQMCKKGLGEAQLSCPEGLALQASRGLLYVADTGNDRIQILNLDGTWHGYVGPTERHASSVTKSGRVQGVVVNHLNQPTDVAVSESFVVVADCGNHKVKIFNHEGVLIHTIGGSGTLRRYFRSPEVVETDSRGNIIVGDSGNARVQIFSAKGELLRVLGGRSSKSKKFGWVSGLLVKDNFDILVADSKNNAVTLF